MALIAPELLTPHPMPYYAFGLVKADEEASEAAPWIIWIRASTEDVDLEHERVSQDALKHAADYFVANGRITWEHTNEDRRYDPSLLVGEPMAVKFEPNGATLVQARLYPLVPRAQSVWQILRSGGKLKASIGGSCAKRPGRDGVMEISQIFWTHIALTPYAVNDHTIVSLQPFQAFLKALGTASAAPLVLQDLEGALEAKTPTLEGRWQALTEVIQQQYPALSEQEARNVAALLLRRRGAFRHAYTSQQWLPL